MNIQRHSLRIATMSFASVPIIAAAMLSPVCAANLRPESEAERFVVEQLRKGESASLEEKFPKDQFPEDRFPDKRSLRGAFVANLLASSKPQLGVHTREIIISGANIEGSLVLTSQEIPYDVYFLNCRFSNNVILTKSHFTKGLSINFSTFEGFVELSGTSIDDDFEASICRFAGFTYFDHLRVKRNFTVYKSTFDTSVVSFESARVGGSFSADNSRFLSKYVSFDDLMVDGTFSARGCVFIFDDRPANWNSVLVETEAREPKVSFIGAHFADFFLNDSSFDKIATIDFTRMQAEFISFDGVKSMTPSEVKLQRMTFKLLSPVNAGQLEFLLSNYNPEFYTDLETSWRTHGYPDEADRIFIAKKRAERREQCKDFFRQCNKVTWASSMFQDMLAGYGKRLQNLLYWSLGFLVVGTLVFRSEKGMRTKNRNDAQNHEGKYHAFWYSLDLFLPIIKLGEADMWTPKDERRWAHLYRKMHIIIGSLFVPIGLAAWTGIIK